MRNQTIVSGTVVDVMPIEHVGQKGHPKRIVVVSTGGQYPEALAVEYFGDRTIGDAANIANGDQVEIEAYIKGREHKGRYFTSLSARAGGTKVVSAAPRGGQSAPAPTFGTDDDIPF